MHDPWRQWDLNTQSQTFPAVAEGFFHYRPDVVGMPGKSAPYRNISSSKDEYGIWIKEVLDHYKVDKISFVVSSYSSAMFLSFAKSYPEMVDKALLLVPSGNPYSTFRRYNIRTSCFTI